MTDVFLADPALYGLDGRVPGSPCPVPCSRDCDRGCHEAHKATRLLHDPYYCHQLTLGRDVSEYEPEVRQWWETELRAARAQAERELAPYRGKMSAAQIDQLLRQYGNKQLLERHGLPRLSLFYL